MTNKFCDLHIHTTRSDGTLSPAEVVRAAKNAGIVCLAMTDHDTVSGIDEAIQEGMSLGVEVIPGVEISVEHAPGIMHILGYFIDWKKPGFSETLSKLQSDRRERNQKIVERLTNLGMPVAIEELVADLEENQISRLHFARLLIRKGFVKTREEAFEKFLGKGKPAYVPRAHLSVRDAINFIRSAGGLASLAHPGYVGFPVGSEEFLQLMHRLKSDGLSGLEVYSSAHDGRTAQRLLELAGHFGFLPTGGSDFHGDNKNIPLGYCGRGFAVPYEWVAQMKNTISGEKKSPRS